MIGMPTDSSLDLPHIPLIIVDSRKTTFDVSAGWQSGENDRELCARLSIWSHPYMLLSSMMEIIKKNNMLII